jgi:hypothetical protein
MQTSKPAFYETLYLVGKILAIFYAVFGLNVLLHHLKRQQYKIKYTWKELEQRHVEEIDNEESDEEVDDPDEVDDQDLDKFLK